MRHFIVTFLTLCFVCAGTMARAQEESEKKQESDAATKGQAQEAETVEEILSRATDHFREGDFDKTIELLDSALKQDPENLQARSILVRTLEVRASELIKDDDRAAANPYLIRAAAVIRQIVESQGNDSRIKARLASYIYREAASYAIANETEKALATLKESFDWGFQDMELASSDEDLKSLFEIEAFKSMIEKQTEIIAELMAKEAEEEIANFETYDFDFQLTNLDGEEVGLEDYRGKVIIVDFWGTWCGPCIAEIPSFNKLIERHGERGFDVVGLAYEHGDTDEENIERVQKFLEKTEMNYTCVMGDEETQKQIPAFGGFPTTLFIDREGKVRLELVGMHSFIKLNAIVSHLLDEGP